MKALKKLRAFFVSMTYELIKKEGWKKSQPSSLINLLV